MKTLPPSLAHLPTSIKRLLSEVLKDLITPMTCMSFLSALCSVYSTIAILGK